MRNGVQPVVFDRYARIGGLLTFGIPPFKLEKEVVEKRREIMEGMGVEFRLGCRDRRRPVASTQLLAEYDAVFLGMGTYTAVRGGFAGEDLPGVHEALPYLISNINHELELPGAAAALVEHARQARGGARRRRYRHGLQPHRHAPGRGVGDLHLPARRGATCRARGATTRTAARRASSSCSTASRSRSSARERVEGVKLVTTRLGAPDARGRRVPQAVAGSEQIVPADAVIVAFGFLPSPPRWFDGARHPRCMPSGRVRVSAGAHDGRSRPPTRRCSPVATWCAARTWW